MVVYSFSVGVGCIVLVHVCGDDGCLVLGGGVGCLVLVFGVLMIVFIAGVWC